MVCRWCALLLVVVGLVSTAAADELTDGFAQPPREARLRAYWWWLNGFVTKESITRDLEEMKAKGFGGALICDADGSSQDGNDRAPHGPDFFSPAWRELYKHTLREADRLGVEMSLNLQSGWNMGGPMITADQAPKKIVWAEEVIAGPARCERALPVPSGREGFYRDALVVAYRLKPEAAARAAASIRVTASSEGPGHAVGAATDGNPATFWVGGGKKGDGPSRTNPAWIRLDFASPATADRVTIRPRPGYGPRECELQSSDDGVKFTAVKAFAVEKNGTTIVRFDATKARAFRVVIFGSFDPLSPDAPRNVQIAELELAGPAGTWPGKQPQRPTLANWREKAGHATLHFSAPDSTPLLIDDPAQPGEEEARAADVIDLTKMLDANGVLTWDVPAGPWQVLRFGYTVSDHGKVSTSSEGWQGFAIDPLDADAFRCYWNAIVEPLIADAGPLAGKSLKYLHTDSWEIEPYNWTPSLPAEFQRRRGYDLRPWMPVLAGRIVDSREASNRFLHDFRKTLGDLAIDHHYKLFRDGAHRHGLAIHPEAGGPHAVPIDAQRCLGYCDVPMSEFWAWSWRHRIGDANRFFVKQPASAAHVYGHKLVAAEGFTTIGPHWQETIWDNLKPAFDKACCEGLNLLVWHAFVCSPAEAGVPGIQYFAGTHFNPNTTWWAKSGPFLAYVNRCQYLLQQGQFVGDVCYYYGDHVPNFAQRKGSDPTAALPGYDYDVITAEALLERAEAKDGRLVLPDGTSYRLLVLRDNAAMSLPVLRKVKQLADAGVPVIGPKPARAATLFEAKKQDAEVGRLADDLWGSGKAKPAQPARDVLAGLGVPPDFEARGGDDKTEVDYLHRRAGAADIYFVANRSPRAEHLQCTFRVGDRAPELWDAVSGVIRPLPEFEVRDGRTTVSLQFAPCGSWFVVFRSAAKAGAGGKNFASYRPVGELSGAWQVSFDPEWGGPKTAEFAQLVDWTERPEPGIKFYSGTATYRKRFDAPAASAGQRVFLDLGNLRELAEVRLNGRSLGIVWAPPFRVELTPALRPTGNELEVDIVNFWPNRIIGDDALPADQRRTKTNIRKLTKDTKLMPSGLLGPVQFQVEE